MGEDEKKYKATIINSPMGNNNPILKFKLEDETYIEKDYDYGKQNWGKGQTFYLKYNNNKIEVVEKYRFRHLYKIPFLLYPIIFIFAIGYIITNLEKLDFYVFGIFVALNLIPVILSCIIYYTRDKKMREKSEQRTKGKIIAFLPIFKSHFQQGTGNDINKTYYEMEWRVLFEFKTYNGEIFRCLENDKIFGGDRNVLTHIFTLNEVIPIKYNIENPSTAFIDNNEYEFKFRDFKGAECKAKIVEIETVEIDSLEKENVGLKDCFKQDYLICEYKIGNQTYKEKSQYPVNHRMFSIGEEISIRYNTNNCKEYNVSYTIWK